MPRTPKRPCRFPGCPNLSDGLYCEEHKREAAKTSYTRGNANERGYNRQWNKARLYFLNEHPLCAECMRTGRLTPATVVDHIIPHRGDQKLFWDENNWQPLCKRCHDIKTGKGL